MKFFNGRTFGFLILLGIVFVAGFVVRGALTTEVQGDGLSVFWEAWEVVEDKYPFDNIEPNAKERIYAATAGMVDAFDDPHTSFLPPQESRLFQEEVLGEFGGVGMEVDTRDGLVVVVSPLKDSPAERAGVLPGDIVVGVDGESVLGLDIDEVVSKIRGPLGQSVMLELSREDHEGVVEVTIVRETIKIPTIEYEQLSDDVYYIALYSFTQESPELFAEALQAFLVSGAGGLVVDFRSNPGGYLEAGVEIASMFLPEGKVIVRQDNGRAKGEGEVFRSLGYEFVPDEVDLVILVDQGSASASEIVAGALREQRDAVLVGGQTFGKGSVQELVGLSDGSSVKVTIAHWETPDGLLISEEGLVPDHVVENRIEDGAAVDLQLPFAQKLLEKGA